MARERPELTYYCPKYKSTFWTLLLLADVKAPLNNWQIDQSLGIVLKHFYNNSQKIFTLGTGHFPVPCLNGNMLYLHFYFKKTYTDMIEKVVDFFNLYQCFDDGDFRTLKTFPYYSNAACYGRHTCYWGIIKLLKGLSFIPLIHRTPNSQRLIDNCIDFILNHGVCFQSHNKDEFIQHHMGSLIFPYLWKDDFLEILWLRAREGVKDKKMSRVMELLRSKRKNDGHWELEHLIPNLIVSLGRKGCANAFITEKALEVLNFYVS